MKRLLLPAGLMLGVVATLAAAPVPPPEKLLGQDTLFVVTVPDCTKAGVNWAKSPSSQLWTDEAMRPFREKFAKKFQSAVTEPMEKEFGIKFSDYTSLAQGQVTFAVTAPKSDGEGAMPGFLLLVDARDKSEALKSNLTALKKKWVDSGKQIKTEKIRDVEFSTLIFKSDEVGKVLEKVFPDPKAGFESLDEPKTKKAAQSVELILGQSDTLLVLGNSVKDVEKVLAAQAGSGVAPLSELPAFSRNYASSFRDANGYAWVHLKPLVAMAVKAFSKNDPNDPGAGGGMFPKPDKILGALGITGVHALSVTSKSTPDGDLVAFSMDAPASERRGLVKAFSFEPKDANPPAFVPADAVKFTRVRIDLNKAWNTIEAALTEAIPQMAGVFKMVLENAGKDKDPNFDLRKQLFENLGDDIISYEKAPRKQTIEALQSAPSVTLVSSARPEQLASAVKALTALLPMGAGKVKEREFLGRKVYSMSMPSMQPGGKMGERTISYAASGGYVVISADTPLLEEFMRSSDGGGKALRDSPGLSEAAQKVGGMATGMFGYENQSESMKSVLETLKKDSGSLTALLAMSPLGDRLGLDDDGAQLKEWVDFSLLPPFERISKYFGIAVWSGNLTADGMSLKYFAPTPPGVKK